MSFRKMAAASCVAVVLAAGLVFAQNQKGASWPVTIDVPGFTGDSVPLLTAGAWPLTIRMLANNPVGIGTYSVPFPFPVDGRQLGFVVFDDPDGCFSLNMSHDQELSDPTPPPCPGGNDETYLEFAAGINHPGLPKTPVEKVRALELGGPPLLLGYSESAGNAEEFWIGPGTGNTADNYGYGSSPNVPGLVVLSDTGVGQVWDPETFDLATPRVARNLAGFVNSLSWALNDCSPSKMPDCRTSVTAHLNVPQELFMPVVRVDWNYPDDQHQWQNVDYRVDGGPWVHATTPAALRADLNARTTIIRVFVLSGRAPDQFVDLDGDGRVTAKDAVLAGYTVLSGGDKVIRVRTYHQEENPSLGIQYDGNGNGMLSPPAPAGGGGITPIPR